jgi:hypothetical protein
MNRKTWDQLVSTAGVVLVVALVVLGGLAIYGGNFGRNAVKDRLTPQQVQFPAYDAMTPQEQVSVGQYAGQLVDTGPEAEAFSRYIAGHLAQVNGGLTYSQTSAAARVEGLPAAKAADLQAKADTLFKGETLRSILLNAYGWWTVATIALYAGWFMIAAGIILGVLAIFGFVHAGKVAWTPTKGTTEPTVIDERPKELAQV